MADLAAATAGWEPPVLEADDPMHPGPATALATALDRPAPEGKLPALWQWVYFPEWTPASALGADGHPAGGGLHPTLPERTRMYLGGPLQVRRPLLLGETAHRHSAVVGQRITEGRTGTMLLVTVRHEIFQGGLAALVDEQDVMYRSGPGRRPGGSGAEEPEVPAIGPWRAPVPTDPVLLFRFSALTANSHRIHYDHLYATEVEGYPGLVVQGTLLALAMADLAADRGGRHVASMRYRLQRPVFAGDTVDVVGHPVAGGAELYAVTAGGSVAARAEAGWA